MGYVSQCGQDKFVDKYFKGKTNGVFVDFGAMDGVRFSNSYFLERERGWTGLCIEPNPIQYDLCVAARTCKCSNAGIASKNGELSFIQITGYGEGLSCFNDFAPIEHIQRIERVLAEHGGHKEIKTIKVRPLEDVLVEYGIDQIDYMSVDIEEAEYEALYTFDLKKHGIKLLTIENNSGSARVQTMMAAKGYKLITKLEQDDVYVQI